MFWAFANRERVQLTAISPFLGSLPDFSSVVEFARFFLRNDDSSFTLVTRPPRKRPEMGTERVLDEAQAQALVTLGVDLRIRKGPPLHSKIYRFQLLGGAQVSFVGSANFTIGGFRNNDETVVFLASPPENTQVNREVARLVGPGAFPYTEWNIRQKLSGELE